MTKEEAVSYLEFEREQVLNKSDGITSNLTEAYDMAIKALQTREYGKWKNTANEKPDSSRHVIVAFGDSDISHYGYYLEPKDKWYTDWICTNETPEPKAWMEMPKIPKGIRCEECSCG